MAVKIQYNNLSQRNEVDRLIRNRTHALNVFVEDVGTPANLSPSRKQKRILVDMILSLRIAFCREKGGQKLLAEPKERASVLESDCFVRLIFFSR